MFCKEQFLNLVFLSKPHQPNGYDDRMALADPPEGFELDTPNIHDILTKDTYIEYQGFIWDKLLAG